MGIAGTVLDTSLLGARKEAPVGTVVEMETRSAWPSPRSESAPPDESALPSRLRVLIADDEPEGRETLVSVDEGHPGRELAGVAADGAVPETAWLDRTEVPHVVRPRAVPPGAPGRQLGRVVIDADAREVYVDGVEVELTRLEFDLLETLTARPRVVFTRAKLLG